MITKDELEELLREHGDFINPPEGFFDTIDNLLNQMLGLD